MFEKRENTLQSGLKYISGHIEILEHNMVECSSRNLDNYPPTVDD